LANPNPNAEPPAATGTGSRRIIGPFTVRQLGTVAGVVAVAVLALIVVTRPIAPGLAGATALPVSTPFLVGPATVGLQPGDIAPELASTAADGTVTPLTDLDGKPVRLSDLRGKLVWLNFWATWCPPCQGETPVLRDMDEAYRARGLVIVGVAVQETTVDDVRAYAQRYLLGYRIAFDATAGAFNRYRVFALPTQVFVGPDGTIRQVVNGPMTDDTAQRLIESWLPSPQPSD
jgi:thiol-disulfide isomerase/thioredoxin